VGWTRVCSPPAQQFNAPPVLDGAALAVPDVEHRAEAGIASAPDAKPRNFAIASRCPALSGSPMALIFPLSSAARTDLALICRSVSGRGAPAVLPALWQVAQLA